MMQNRRAWLVRWAQGAWFVEVPDDWEPPMIEESIRIEPMTITVIHGTIWPTYRRVGLLETTAMGGG